MKDNGDVICTIFLSVNYGSFLEMNILNSSLSFRSWGNENGF